MPLAKVEEIDQFGLVSVTFSNEISFPEDMLAKINEYTDPIIISPNKPFIPLPNKFGFFEVAYVKVLLLASEEADVDDLAYTWSATSITSTELDIQLVFEKPL